MYFSLRRMNDNMKWIWQFLIGGVAGFFGAFGILFVSDFHYAAHAFVISLYALTVILIILSIVQYKQIKTLNETKWTGEDEDEADELKYKRFANYSLLTNSSMVLSLLALSISAIIFHIGFIIIGIILTITTYLFSNYMIRLMKYVYPERNIPDSSDPDFSMKLLEVSDDGEKFVILEGLYKSYQLLNSLLVLAIILATIYSIATDNSQTFSIIAMSLVLLLVNGKYLLVVRKRT